MTLIPLLPSDLLYEIYTYLYKTSPLFTKESDSKAKQTNKTLTYLPVFIDMHYV